MAIKYGLLIGSSFILLAGACKKHVASKLDYVRLVEDKSHGFRKEQTIAHWAYKVQYKPASYIILHEKNRTEANTEARIKQLKDWRFFNVYVRHDSITQYAPLRLVSTDLESYNTNLSFYLSQNKSNFLLLVDTVPLYPTVYQFENDYNLSPEDVFVVGFHMPAQYAEKEPEKLILQYDDQMLRNGIVRFVFKQQDLDQEPTLTVNQLTYE